jgi:hypothetical protein
MVREMTLSTLSTLELRRAQRKSFPVLEQGGKGKQEKGNVLILLYNLEITNLEKLTNSDARGVACRVESVERYLKTSV